jgi:hypothetical protein
MSENGPPSGILGQVAYLRVRLIQPKLHFHLTVHGTGHGELRARLIPLTGAQVQPAQPMMTTRNQPTWSNSCLQKSFTPA